MTATADPPAGAAALPRISVIITTYNARATVDACLTSVFRQDTASPYEVILVDSSSDGTAEFVRERYPQVRLLTSASRLYCGDARNLALAVTRAPIVAFLDADCFVEPSWIAALLEAHRSPHLLVGGSIENGTPASALAWAYYFCEFSLWLPRKRPAEIGEIAGSCLSFKREAYDRYGPFLGGTYSSDTVFQWRARQDGHTVLSSPAVRVFHTWQPGLRAFLAHVYEHRRFFARLARRQFGIRGWRLWLAVALSPVYPFGLLALTGWRVLGCLRYLPRFLWSLPIVFLGFCARAAGEVSGLLDAERERPK